MVVRQGLRYTHTRSALAHRHSRNDNRNESNQRQIILIQIHPCVFYVCDLFAFGYLYKWRLIIEKKMCLLPLGSTFASATTWIAKNEQKREEIMRKKSSSSRIQESEKKRKTNEDRAASATTYGHNQRRRTLRTGPEKGLSIVVRR